MIAEKRRTMPCLLRCDQTSKAPIFSSHSCCLAISDAPRNMTDEIIKALGQKGGLIQINFSCGRRARE
jgi:microsomal dipeptidase-like Zn-dependent dipeptidase